MQHALPAAWATTLPLHLQDLGFNAHQIGHIFGTLALSPLIAPWIAGQLADRVFSPQAIIIFCNIVNVAVLWTASYQTTFWPILFLCLASSMLWIPTFALTTHIALRHLHRTPEKFGSIRLFGTLGWVTTTLLMGLWLSKPTWLPGAQDAVLADGFRISAIWSVLATIVCLMTPRTPPSLTVGAPRFAAASAITVVRDPQVFAVLLVGFLLAITNPFVHPVGAIFMRDLGLPNELIPPISSTGQMVEVIAFALTAVLLRRIGFKALFTIGIAFYIVRLVIWSIGEPLSLVILSVGLHGFCYAWVVGLTQMILDQRCPPDAKATAQSLYLVLTVGIPSWPANQLAAWLSEQFRVLLPSGASGVDYRTLFIVPMVICVVCLILFVTLFRRPRPSAALQP
ncbi:MAG: MFS transporter [Phycisphaerae bacterium]